MFDYKESKKKNGFTVIEAIVAIFILTVGIIACSILADQVFRSASTAKDRLIAVSLAQEGVEVIRNIRDNSWLAPDPTWKDDLPIGTWKVSYNSSGVSAYVDGEYLKINTEGFYNYESGTDTTFKRKIIITHISEFEIKVEVIVYWVTRGTEKNITIVEHFYDWK